MNGTSLLTKEKNQELDQFAIILLSLQHLITQRAEHISGVKCENNKRCLSVHYRHVEAAHLDQLERIVLDVVEQHNTSPAASSSSSSSSSLEVVITHGQKVWELRPRIEWQKGKACVYLLNQAQQSLRNPNCQSSGGGACGQSFLPIYIGDDRTDEDAFVELRQRKKSCSCGCSITVFVKPPSVPHRPTCAEFVVNGVDQVHVFLQLLLQMQ